MDAVSQLLLECVKHLGQRNQLVDIYNKHLPLARGYRVKYSDLLCATSVSAIFISLGWTDIMPTECSCPYLWKLCSALEITERKAKHTPQPGDVIFFWNEMSSTLCHVGIVYEVSLTSVRYYDTTSSWGQHIVPRSSSTIYGYATPNYSKIIVPDPQPVTEIKAGDLVFIRDGAKWFTGATILPSVLAQNWYVIQNKGGRVVLGLNEAKTTNICSPIHEADVGLIGDNAPFPKVEITADVTQQTYGRLVELAKDYDGDIGKVLDSLV